MSQARWSGSSQAEGRRRTQRPTYQSLRCMELQVTAGDASPSDLTMAALAARLREERDRIRVEMGGLERIERIHAKGRFTIRERIGQLVDAGSFVEIGTFARS